jgi:isocitrate lyase
MKAYVELIQRRERDIGCDVLTHQKVSQSSRTDLNHGLMILHQWSGADYVDGLLMTAMGGISSTAAMGKGVTEAQFVAKGKL